MGVKELHILSEDFLACSVFVRNVSSYCRFALHFRVSGLSYYCFKVHAQSLSKVKHVYLIFLTFFLVFTTFDFFDRFKNSFIIRNCKYF